MWVREDDSLLNRPIHTFLFGRKFCCISTFSECVVEGGGREREKGNKRINEIKEKEQSEKMWNDENGAKG